MNYAIDITRPRTKLAMLALGIEPEELIVKTAEDFAGRNVNEDVKQLRFNYHTRKLKEIVRQINSSIKEETIKKIQSIRNASKSPQQVFLTQSPVPEKKEQDGRNLQEHFLPM